MTKVQTAGDECALSAVGAWSASGALYALGLPRSGAPVATRLLLGLISAGIVASSAGCAFQREFLNATVLGASPREATAKAQAVGGSVDAGPAVSVLDVAESPHSSQDLFVLRPMAQRSSKPLPDVPVAGLSLSESGLQDALEMLAAAAKVSLHFEGGARGLERYGPVSLTNFNGTMDQVLDRLSRAMGFFWSFDGSTISIEPDRVYVLELPPAIKEDTLAGATNTIQALGAKDVYLDRLARTLVFRSNATSLGRIDSYVNHLRETRVQMIYEMQIYQVDLTDSNKQGINWSRLGGSSVDRAKDVTLTTPGATGSSGAAAVAGGAVPGGAVAAGGALKDLASAISMTSSPSGIGTILMGPKFNVDLLVNFLKTQGTVRTLSQPRLAMLSGEKGVLRVGQSTTFVSKVGTNQSTGISQVTVETRDLRTGLQLSLIGEESDGTVYTRVALSLSDLLQFQRFQALGTDLTLPVVSDRDLETSIRLPPGYSAVLGGITVQRSNADRTIGASANVKNSEVSQSELVIVLRPTVVRFKKRDIAQAPAPASSGAPSTGPGSSKPSEQAPVTAPGASTVKTAEATASASGAGQDKVAAKPTSTQKPDPSSAEVSSQAKAAYLSPLRTDRPDPSALAAPKPVAEASAGTSALDYKLPLSGKSLREALSWFKPAVSLDEGKGLPPANLSPSVAAPAPEVWRLRAVSPQDAPTRAWVMKGDRIAAIELGGTLQGVKVVKIERDRVVLEDRTVIKSEN